MKDCIRCCLIDIPQRLRHNTSWGWASTPLFYFSAADKLKREKINEKGIRYWNTPESKATEQESSTRPLQHLCLQKSSGSTSFHHKKYIASFSGRKITHEGLAAQPVTAKSWRAQIYNHSRAVLCMYGPHSQWRPFWRKLPVLVIIKRRTNLQLLNEQKSPSHQQVTWEDTWGLLNCD